MRTVCWACHLNISKEVCNGKALRTVNLQHLSLFRTAVWLENRDTDHNFFFFLQVWWGKKYGWSVNNNKSSLREHKNIAGILNLFCYCSVKCCLLSYWARRLQSIMQIDSVPIHFSPVFSLFVSHRAIFLMPDICSLLLFCLFTALLQPSSASSLWRGGLSGTVPVSCHWNWPGDRFQICVIEALISSHFLIHLCESDPVKLSLFENLTRFSLSMLRCSLLTFHSLSWKGLVLDLSSVAVHVDAHWGCFQN